jgi:hypothetical protein
LFTHADSGDGLIAKKNIAQLATMSDRVLDCIASAGLKTHRDINEVLEAVYRRDPCYPVIMWNGRVIKVSKLLNQTNVIEQNK